jgi:hypothetical protein
MSPKADFLVGETLWKEIKESLRSVLDFIWIFVIEVGVILINFLIIEVLELQL